MEKPQKVRDAQGDNYDPEALSKMGRSGVQKTHAILAKRREHEDVRRFITREKTQAEENQLRHSTNEDILTVDGEDPNDLN